MKLLFGLTVRDVDCDFRLIRRSVFDTVKLEKSSGVICLELMKKITGRAIHRSPKSRCTTTIGCTASRSSSTFRRLARTAVDVFALWSELVWRAADGAAADPAGRSASQART